MSTTKRDQVMDYYWLQFLVSCEGDFTTEHAPTADFWFIVTLSDESAQAAKIKWDEALQSNQPVFMVPKEELTS